MLLLWGSGSVLVFVMRPWSSQMLGHPAVHAIHRLHANTSVIANILYFFCQQEPWFPGPDLSGGGLSAAALRRRWRPALGRPCAVRWRGQAEGRAGLRVGRTPTRGLSAREGGPLQVDGRFHGLEQDVALFGVELKVPLPRLTPSTCLEGEGGLGGTERGLKCAPAETRPWERVCPCVSPCLGRSASGICRAK